VCRSIVVNEKPSVDSPFFRVFPSDRIPKAMKDINVPLFIHSFTFRNELIWTVPWPSKIPVYYTSEFQEIFEAIA
jgi:hypothetical protein